MFEDLMVKVHKKRLDDWLMIGTKPKESFWKLVQAIGMLKIDLISKMNKYKFCQFFTLVQAVGSGVSSLFKVE